jgi:hypothetical protein
MGIPDELETPAASGLPVEAADGDADAAVHAVTNRAITMSDPRPAARVFRRRLCTIPL